LNLNLTQAVQATAQRIGLVVSALHRHPKRVLAVFAAVLLGGAGASFAVANLAPDAAKLPQRTLVESVETLPLAPQFEALATQAMRLYRTDITRSTDTADTLLKRLGVSDVEAAAFLRSDRLVQQTLMGRAGRNVSAEVDERSGLLALSARWSPEDDGNFKRLTISKSEQGYSSKIETLPLTVSSRIAGGVIQSSLFAATDDARIPDSIAVQMAEIFSGDIDFHRALRKGDRFSVVYETLEGDGEPLRAGRVLSTEFVNAGKTFQAMWFQEPLSTNTPAATTALSKGGYYTLAGESLRRAFLASPMAFSRVTSGFAMRFHPIMKTWRAHLGVDYGAATGTPVRTVGDGVVEFAGVQNGFGNVVFIKHGGGNTTVYAHLSKINVRNGQRVQQGDNIGLVGATGWATGPHLHFEFRVGGVHKDPLTLARARASEPLAAALKPQFDKSAQLVRAQLSAAAQVQVGNVQ
jgi:murein DD-endopeptidase MepM/ murein hydrolase activator NlpD